MTFDECAEHMDIKVEEVEQWIVRVVSSGIADCKIRQQVSFRARHFLCKCPRLCSELFKRDIAQPDISQDRSVTVTRCTERVFGPREWKMLEENLAVWNSSLSNMISEAFPQP